MSLTWTDHATPTTGNAFQPRKAVWADTLSLFVVVGDHTGTIGGAGSLERVITSPDGVTWTIRNAGAAYQWKSVAWNGTTLVAVSSSTLTTGALVITDQVMTSTNGTAWSTQTSSETNQWNDVVWASSLSLFVAVATTGTHRVMTSPDGVTWTNRTASSAQPWGSIAWSPSLGLLVAAATGAGTTAVMTSPDGINWTDRTLPTSGTLLARGLSWSTTLGTFVLGAGSSNLFTSTNGTTWSNWSGVPTGWGTTSGQSAWSPELSLYVITSGQSNSKVLTSPDAVTWTTQTTGSALSSFDTIAYSPTLTSFAACAGYTGANSDTVALGVGLAQSISPSSGIASGGNTITIGGDGRNGGFQAAGGTLRVRFGTYPLGPAYPDPTTNPSAIIPSDGGTDLADWHVATSVVASSSTSLTCEAPIGQGTVDVLVYLDGSSSANILAWFPAGYTFTNPAIVSLTPSGGPSWGGTAVTVTGTNLFASATGAPGDLFFGNYNTGIGGYAQNVTRVSSTSLTCVAPAGFSTTAVDVTYVPPHLSTPLSFYTYPNSTLSGAYTYVESWWLFSVPDEIPDLVLPDFRFLSFAIPDISDLSDPNGIGNFLRIYFGYTEEAWNLFMLEFPPFRWWTLSTAPDHNGWWGSTADFGGDSFLLASTDRPVPPRTWLEIVAFATGGTGMLGGSPGAGCVFGNRLIYPASTYQNSLPTLRLYNGRSDYTLCTVPPTSSGAAPIAVMSMLAANGSIYLSTLDSGSSSADWVGRVFSLDITSGILTPLGAAFTTGHVPYALAFHNGKLWCGTHRQSTAAAGKVFWIRPGIDTAWTEDHTLSTGSVSSLLSFQGNLYVGTTDAAATFALLLKRDTTGAYTTVDTGSGGTAKASNGWLALAEFSSTLYASYWNDDTTPISKIRKSLDGSSWTTSYTGASGTNRPFIGFMQDNGYLLAIGGGLLRTAAVVRTPDGTTWTDETVFLETTDETALPIFGTVVA